MNNILEELYLGNLRPLDTITPQCEDYENARMERINRIHSLLKKLDSQDQESKKEFDEILDMEGKIESYEISQTFVVGFQLGAKIMFAIYHDD